MGQVFIVVADNVVQRWPRQQKHVAIGQQLLHFPLEIRVAALLRKRFKVERSTLRFDFLALLNRP